MAWSAFKLQELVWQGLDIWPSPCTCASTRNPRLGPERRAHGTDPMGSKGREAGRRPSRGSPTLLEFLLLCCVPRTCSEPAPGCGPPLGPSLPSRLIILIISVTGN